MALVVGHSQTKYLSKYLSPECFSVQSFPGYKVRQFLKEGSIFDAAPFFSVVVLVVGANDIGYKTPTQIITDIRFLCDRIHEQSPSATVIVSEVLPRAQNQFDGCQHSITFLDDWNWDAGTLNQYIRQLCDSVTWVSTIDQYEFHTWLGPVRYLLSRDGLHLSPDGLERLASNIEVAVQSAYPQSSLSPVPVVSPEPTVSTEHKQSEWRVVSHSNRSSGQTKSGQATFRIVPSVQDSPVRDLPSAPTSGTGVPSQKRQREKKSKSTECSAIRNHVVLTKQKVSKQSGSCDSVYVLESERKYYLSTDEIPLLEGGGGDVPIWSETDRVLTTHEAADILIQNIPESTAFEPPYRPKSGRTYLFDDNGNSDKKEDWRADGYTWRNYGKKTYKVNGQVLERHFFKLSNQGVVSDAFQKHAFRFLDSDYNGRTLLVYFGDSAAYQALPHKRRQKNFRPHKRTKPSVIKEIKTRCIDEKPKVLNDKMVSENSPGEKLKGVQIPRNERQIKNLKAQMQKERKLTHDSLYSLHLLVEQLDQYILYTKTIPDLEVIVGNKQIFEEVNKLLQIKDINMELFYDTTFNLGDFYVSTAAIQHPMFKEHPVIPVAYMIHERKFQSCHENFINELKKCIPKLRESNISIISDREKGIINAFKKELSNSTVLICWNHILNDVKFWVYKHGGKSDDKKVYDNHVKELLQCENKSIFNQTLEKNQQLWSQSFVDYFNRNLKEDIISHAARWILEERDIYNPYSGITNNVSESLNAKLKRLIEYKERALDEIVLFLYYSQGNDLSNLIRGFCGESEWTLRNHYRYATLDPETVILPKNVCHPDNLVKFIKGELSNVKKPEPVKQSEPSTKTMRIKSQHTLADRVIEDNDIVFVPQMGAFMVNGSKGEKYSVTIFPKEKCNCPATSRCYHIIAAMKSLGMEVPDEKKTFNLTQLRRNCRPKSMKKCGTKKGRKGDTDLNVNAAPDSVFKTDFENSQNCVTPKAKDNLNTNEKAKRTLFMSTPKSILKTKPTPKTDKKRKLQFENDFHSKIPKIESLVENDEHDSVIFELSSREDFNDDFINTENIDMWKTNLGLNMEDKNALLNNKKLNSNHMEAVNKMLRKQVGSQISGLQLTEYVPVFNDQEERWQYKLQFEPTSSPSCQIHHTHKDHWVCSIYHRGKIYLIDSLGNERDSDKIIPDGLKIQLSKLYGKDLKRINISVPSVVKQTNSIDCGLFAIAFVTYYCLNKKLCHDIIFDSTKLRQHLFKCFNDGFMTDFPKTDKTISSRRSKNVKLLSIDNYCICNLPSCLDNMVQCDKCSCWYHKHCVEAPLDISRQDQEFICFSCDF